MCIIVCWQPRDGVLGFIILRAARRTPSADDDGVAIIAHDGANNSVGATLVQTHTILQPLSVKCMPTIGRVQVHLISWRKVASTRLARVFQCDENHSIGISNKKG
jgi:hypothetical protein